MGPMSVLAVSVWCHDAQILPSKSRNFGALDTNKKKFTLYHFVSLIVNEPPATGKMNKRLFAGGQTCGIIIIQTVVLIFTHLCRGRISFSQPNPGKSSLTGSSQR